MSFSSNDSENAHHLLLLKSYYCNHLLDNNEKCQDAKMPYIVWLSCPSVEYFLLAYIIFVYSIRFEK